MSIDNLVDKPGVLSIIKVRYVTRVFYSVADPWHFGVDPDPDPRIHASDYWIRIRIRIRIRILDPNPTILVIDLQDASKKLIF
jgi:hypothetical protein